MNEFNSLERRAGLQTMQGMQQATIHTAMFMQLLAAQQAGNEKLANFYVERFPPDVRKAYDAWLAQKPFENPKADPHPFVPNLYEVRGTREAAEANAKAASSLQEARNAGSRFRSIPREHCFVCHSAFLRQCVGKVRAAQGACGRVRFCCGGFRICRRADSHASAVKARASPHRRKTDVRLPRTLTWLRCNEAPSSKHRPAVDGLRRHEPELDSVPGELAAPYPCDLGEATGSDIHRSTNPRACACEFAATGSRGVDRFVPNRSRARCAAHDSQSWQSVASTWSWPPAISFGGRF